MAIFDGSGQVVLLESSCGWGVSCLGGVSRSIPIRVGDVELRGSRLKNQWGNLDHVSFWSFSGDVSRGG